jgi:6-phosphogluconolactonase (cycloisomerase 2 family)
MLLLAGIASAQSFVYTNDEHSPGNTVSAFSVAPDGTLSLVPGSPFLTGGTASLFGFFAPTRTRAGVVGNCLFASNGGSSDVSAFTINTTTGVLTLVPGSPFPTSGSSGGNPIALAPTPNSLFLMAANAGSNDVTVYFIASNCALTPIAGSPFPLLSAPDGIKVSPNGSFLAVAEPGASQYEMLRIDSHGSLTSIGGFPRTGPGIPTSEDIDCFTSMLYGGEAGSGTTVDAYSIGSTGWLTPIPGSPFENSLGNNSNVVMLGAKPSVKPVAGEKLLFVSNQSSNTIEVFTVNSKGALSLVAGSPFPIRGGILPVGMDTSPDGQFLYVSNLSGAINVFSVSSKGVLTEVVGSPFPTGQTGFLIALAAFPSRACK